MESKPQEIDTETKQDILEFAVNQILVPHGKERNLEFDLDMYRSIEEEKEKMKMELATDNFNLPGRISNLIEERWNYFKPMIQQILTVPPASLWRQAEQNEQTEEIIRVYQLAFEAVRKISKS